MPRLSRSNRLPLAALAALALAVLASAPPAGAAVAPAAVLVDRAAWDLDVGRSTRRDCRAGIVRRAGAVGRAYRVPVAGVVQARLAGPKGADWDLALFDAASGRSLGASLGFGAREVVALPVGGAQRIVLQACRRTGRGRSARLSVVHAALPVVPKAERMSLVEVLLSSSAQHARLDSLGLDTADHSDGQTLKVVLHGADDARTLAGAGFAPRVLVADLRAHDRSERLAELAAERSGVRSEIPSGRTSYRTLADYQADMKALAEQHPDLVRGFVLPGTSLEGREISGIEVATGVRRTDDGRPQVYIDGVNHAREWPAGEIPLEFAFDLVKNPSADGRLKAILEGGRTFVVPIVNVDGFDASRTAGAGPQETANFGDLPWAATGTGSAYRRKNCRFADQDPPPVPCVAAQIGGDVGVDTNRNYGFGWGGPGASISWSSMTYRGSGPFSEPETTALRKFLFGLQPAMVVSNHTVAALILRPPGQQETPDTPDEAPMKALGDAMADETGYRSQRAWELYDTTGTTIDWTYGALGAFSYTPEIGGDGFHSEYGTTVVPHYDGTQGRGGMRKALVRAAEAGIAPSSHAVIAGRAPAGRTLRVTRTFTTRTWEGSALEPDTHTSAITVPESGRYEWHVSPSRRPYEPSGTWKLTCEQDGKVIETRDLAVERGERASVDLACGEAPSAPSPGAAAPACLDALASMGVRRAARGALRVAYRATAAGRVTVEILRADRRVARLRGGRSGATWRGARRLRNGRYTLRVALVTADGRRDVRTLTFTKRGKRIRGARAKRVGC